ncbi:unnamed protein product [Notodromas monacha]|uniref:BHLH domain-containing protein n=1 Tax=Notodromas monacha TaxID=399045 RepID=A0A7R9GG14_9CRUS|nr:unnamed protein product [Notodromas monacha]CAG0921362.1 unnamed protein product [Notodromas monacha]
MPGLGRVPGVSDGVKPVDDSQHREHRKKSGMKSKSRKLRVGGNSAEIKSYLAKLKDLVPFMPKDKKVSKLEVIHCVIDYICQLQCELEDQLASTSATFPVPARRNSLSPKPNPLSPVSNPRSPAIEPVQSASDDADASDKSPECAP